MAETRVEINEAAVKQLMLGDGVAAHLTKVAARGAAAVQRRGPGKRGGDIVATYARNEGGVLRATFGSTSSFWHLSEFGSINNAATRDLTRAALGLGIRFTPSR